MLLSLFLLTDVRDTYPVRSVAQYFASLKLLLRVTPGQEISSFRFSETQEGSEIGFQDFESGTLLGSIPD